MEPYEFFGCELRRARAGAGWEVSFSSLNPRSFPKRCPKVVGLQAINLPQGDRKRGRPLGPDLARRRVVGNTDLNSIQAAGAGDQASTSFLARAGVCPLCDGTGFVHEKRDGLDFSKPCECRRHGTRDHKEPVGADGAERQQDSDTPAEQLGLAFADGKEQRFREFHEAHPEVYGQLVSLARRAKASGHTHYSARGLWEMLRFDRSVVERVDEPFKLNDHYIAHYARLIMEREPDLAGFFETRQLRSE